MLLGMRIVLTVPLWYKFALTSPRDADTAKSLFLVVCSVPAVCEPPCLLGKRFSRPPRCDRFDIPAYIWCGSLHHIYAVLFRSGSWNSFHESASHTPRRRVKLACKRQVRVSSPKAKYSYHNANLCYYSSIKFLLDIALDVRCFVFFAVAK